MTLLKRKSKLIVILGPTASGKSDLAIKLAQQFNGEIVSADSRQIYQEMNIGTAKPFLIRNSKFKINKKGKVIIINNIPHYLIDIIKPNQEFNVAIYKKLALKTIREIQKRGKIPFLVGGTGLYLAAVIKNIKFPQVPPQKELRKKLEKKSISELFKIYKKLDPEGIKFIEKENKRRLIRAIEVSKVTKKPFWKQRKKGRQLFEILQIGIKPSKERLKKKIIQRVKKMFQLGLEKEVKKLVKKYGWPTSLQTIGYQEWQKFFTKEIDRKEVEKLIIQHTLQFAKRQMAWFSSQINLENKKTKEIYWVKNKKEAEYLIKEFIKNK